MLTNQRSHHQILIHLSKTDVVLKAVFAHSERPCIAEHAESEVASLCCNVLHDGVTPLCYVAHWTVITQPWRQKHISEGLQVGLFATSVHKFQHWLRVYKISLNHVQFCLNVTAQSKFHLLVLMYYVVRKGYIVGTKKQKVLNPSESSISQCKVMDLMCVFTVIILCGMLEDEYIIYAY